MDQQELQQKIAEYYSKLPPEAQVEFSSMKWLETLQNISSKFGLNDEQVKTLGTETTLVLLGMISEDEYKKILRQGLAFSVERLSGLFAEIDSQILGPVREHLNTAYKKNAAGTVEEKTDEQKLEGMLGNMPKYVQDAVLQIDFPEVIFSIGKENDLNIAQMGELEEFVGNIMLGKVESDKAVEILKQKLSLPEENDEKIIYAINEKILKPIREAMKAESPSEEKILPSAGIKILQTPNQGKPGTGQAPELPSGPKPSGGIITQKLSGDFHLPSQKTEYTIPGVSGTPAEKSEPPAPPRTYPPKADPYREPPE